MGLDMYLEKQTYVGNKWKEPKEQIKIEVEGIKQERVSSIVEEVGYWRKANAIHMWFVENVQEGKDDCKMYSVNREQLKTLLDLCREVLVKSDLVEGKINNGQQMQNGKWVDIKVDGKYIKDTTAAAKLLPTQNGFFFGSTDYDEHYYADLELTVEILEAALKEKDGDYHYHSSW